MEIRRRPLQNNVMADLVVNCVNTVADSLPLVMWTDVFYHDTHYPLPVEEQQSAERESRRAEVLAPILRHNDFCSLYLVRQGRGTHIIDGASYGIARGDVYTMGVGMEHYFVGCENLKLEAIHFSAGVFDTETLDTLIEMPGFERFFLAGTLCHTTHQPHYGRWLHLGPDDYLQVSNMIEELRTEWHSGTPSGVLLTRCLFVRLLVHLARLHAARPESTHRQALRASTHNEIIIAAAVHYMDEHFTEQIRIPQIAEMVYLSHDRFTKVFTKVMGRPPSDYLHHLRIERAKTLLTTTNLSILDIALESGFGEVSYFSREFHKRIQITPSVYRKHKLGNKFL